MSREKLVRDTAYSIWESEGRPDGREADHWRQAEERVGKDAPKQGQTAASPAAKGRPKKEPAPKPIAAKGRPKKSG